MAKKTTAQAPKVNPDSYFAKRLAEFGADPNNPPTFAEHLSIGDEDPTITPRAYFEQTENGSIQINYPELAHPRQQNYTTEAARWATRRFARIRNHPDLNKPNKYASPKGSGVHLFFTPGVRQAFEEGAEIPVLVMVEGEFKAWALWHFFQIPAIGMPGITGYKTKGAEHPHPDLLLLFRTCQVGELVLLHDADATTPDWAKWQKDKSYDLGRKLNSFFHSVINFYELMSQHVGEVYYTRIQERFNEQGGKGIDDLINKHFQHPEAFETICAELLSHTREGDFLETINMTKEGRGAKLRGNVFLIPTRNNPPTQFYTKFASRIDTAEFVFLRGRYVWSDLDEGLTMQQHPEADSFVRIGTDYFKTIFRPRLKGEGYDRRLEPWKVTAITQDYVKEKGLSDFLSWIPKFDAAVNIPQNNPRLYKQAVETPGDNGKTSVCYNLYNRIDHEPEAGDWPTIENYLKHIFPEKDRATAVENEPSEGRIKGETFEVNRYQMALDYLQMLYLTPTQQLPIVALVSEEQHTGKSTFLHLLNDIFQDNATTLGNQEITDNFNDDFATKLCICLDEGLIEKKSTVEKIKAWSTSDKINVNTKNVSRQRVDFFGKVIICSNNERNFLPIDQNDSRFWITKVRRYTGPEDPHIREKMKAEIPALLHFLSERELAHPEKTRHWFSYNLLESEAKDKLKGGSKDWLQGEFEAWIREQFLDRYQWPELYFSIKEIEAGLNSSTSSIRFRKMAINDLLHHVYKLKAKNSTFKVPLPIVNGERQKELGEETEKKKGRFYTFPAEMFLSPEEMKEIFNVEPDPEPTTPPNLPGSNPKPQKNIDEELENPEDPTEPDVF